MGGFSGSNPLVRMGAMAIDAYTGVPVANTALAVNDARQQQKEQAARQEEMQRSYNLQSTALQRQLQQQVKRRGDLLQSAVSAQRARMSAMGVGGGGSANALLAGLSEQAATEVADLQAEFGDRQAALDLKHQQQAGRQASSFDIWSSSLAPVVASLPSPSRERKQGDVARGLSLL